MNIGISVALSAVFGYLLGSVNTALIVSHLFKHSDIRRQGSGNAGATNMFRTYGMPAALLTALGDLLKAVSAVILARVVFDLAQPVQSPLLAWLVLDPGYLAGFFVLLGHIFPIYFGFKGGKGVMPALGIILLVNPLAFLVLFAISLPVFLISRTMSLVSVLAAILLPLVTLATRLLQHAEPTAATLITLAYSVLVLLAHRDNIRRLLSGSEKPILPGNRK